jgi:Ni,Fe-hydrogenase III small subunit
MLKTIRKILKVGLVSKPIDKKQKLTADEFEVFGNRCQEIIKAKFKSSLAIRHIDAGSCNGCELEIHALNNAIYSIERFGIKFVASPRHADLLLVTGPVAKHMAHALLTTYNAVPDPKLVIAVGNCGVNGGEFGCSYASLGSVNKVIPVDAAIHGCPPSPLTILKGILTILERMQEHAKK